MALVGTKNKKLFLLFCLFAAISCRSTDDKIQGGRVVTIPAERSDFLEFVQEYEHIVLDETNEESLFAYITGLRIAGGNIFILDWTTQRFMLFDTAGVFLKKIGHQGRGPSEYIRANKIEVDHSRQEVVLVDSDGSKILSYDFNGELLRVEHLGLRRLGNIIPLSDGNIASAYSPIGYYQFGGKDGDYKLWVCDKSGNILNRFYSDDLRMNYGIETSDNIITHTDGTATFSPQFSNQIFEITTNKLIPKYKIEFLSPALKHDEINSLTTDSDFSESELNGKTFFAGDHAESPDFLYVQSGFLQVDHVFYNKLSSNVIRTSDPLCGQFVTTDEDGYFWATVNTNRLWDDTREEAKKIVASSGDMNTVLVRYRLKKD